MKRLLLWCFLSLAAFPLSATPFPLSIQPVGPTSVDRVTIHYSTPCIAQSETVSHAGNVIKIEAQLGTVCFPAVDRRAVTIDPLSPGEYRVEIFHSGVDGVQATMTFVVRNGTPAVIAHPFAIRAGALPLPRVRIAAAGREPICEQDDCAGVTIRVGGLVVSNVQGDQGAVWFTPPDLPPGPAALEIVRANGSQRVEAALYYFDEPDPSVFERVLFPVLDDLRGTNGSHWVSDAVIANPNRWYVETWNYVQPVVCVTYPCAERLDPRSHHAFRGDGHPNGVVLYVPRSEADALSFGLRVRDTSRQAEGFGTEIPVVRENEMSSGTLTLLDVPRDPRYRVRLRAYAIARSSSPDTNAGVTIIDIATGARSSFTLPLLPGSATQPLHGQLELPPGTAGERAAVYVVPPDGTLGWAFATITNNETQEVTIVAPDGAGGVPCTACSEP